MSAADNGGEPMNTVAGLETTTLVDGFFHLTTWAFVAIAMLVTVRLSQRREVAPPWRAHFGMPLAGWGVFNVVEGLIDHQVLGIHHVRDDLGAPIGWDLAFLALGVILIAVGFRHGSLGRATRAPGGGTLAAAHLALLTAGLPRPTRGGQRMSPLATCTSGEARRRPTGGDGHAGEHEEAHFHSASPPGHRLTVRTRAKQRRQLHHGHVMAVVPWPPSSPSRCSLALK